VRADSCARAFRTLIRTIAPVRSERSREQLRPCLPSPLAKNRARGKGAKVVPLLTSRSTTVHTLKKWCFAKAKFLLLALVLLKGDRGSGALEGFLRLVCVFLGGTFENRLRSTVNQILGFLQAQARQ